MEARKFYVLAGSRILVLDENNQERILILQDDVEVQSTKNTQVTCSSDDNISEPDNQD
jgi:hypothetical protein